MLVLTRKSQESVMVGSADPFACMLKVTVLEICGGKVKLGFEAGTDILVHRWEIWERLRANGPSEGPGQVPAAPVP